jgi:hypothetical protein
MSADSNSGRSHHCSCACLRRLPAPESTCTQQQHAANNTSAVELDFVPVERAAAAADDLDAVPPPAAPPSGRRHDRLRPAAVSGATLDGRVAAAVDDRAACQRKYAKHRSDEACDRTT